jgi:hypothetical protein
MFEVEARLHSSKAILKKNGVAVDPTKLSEKEKLEVIDMFLRRIASELNSEWEISIGDDL